MVDLISANTRCPKYELPSAHNGNLEAEATSGSSTCCSIHLPVHRQLSDVNTITEYHLLRHNAAFLEVLRGRSYSHKNSTRLTPILSPPTPIFSRQTNNSTRTAAENAALPKHRPDGIFNHKGQTDSLSPTQALIIKVACIRYGLLCSFEENILFARPQSLYRPQFGALYRMDQLVEHLQNPLCYLSEQAVDKKLPSPSPLPLPTLYA